MKSVSASCAHLQIRGVRIAILVFVIFYETRIVVYGRHLVWLGHGGFDLAGGRHSTGGSKLSGESEAERESEKLEERIR